MGDQESKVCQEGLFTRRGPVLQLMGVQIASEKRRNPWTELETGYQARRSRSRALGVPSSSSSALHAVHSGRVGEDSGVRAMLERSSVLPTRRTPNVSRRFAVFRGDERGTDLGTTDRQEAESIVAPEGNDHQEATIRGGFRIPARSGGYRSAERSPSRGP